MKLIEGPVTPMPEAAITALRTARIVPVRDYMGKNILLYDMFLGPKWHGSRRSLTACKIHMNQVLKRIEDDARNAAGEHTPKGVSQGAESKEHHEGAV